MLTTFGSLQTAQPPYGKHLTLWEFDCALPLAQMYYSEYRDG
jgi:hypothetical protein